MPQKKVLDVTLFQVDNHVIGFISKQSHVGQEFGLSNQEWTASNGFDLLSVYCTDIYTDISEHNKLFVRGSRDFHQEFPSSIYFEFATNAAATRWADECKAAVEAYNQFFDGSEDQEDSSPHHVCRKVM